MVNDATSTKRTFDCENINPDTYNNTEKNNHMATWRRIQSNNVPSANVICVNDSNDIPFCQQYTDVSSSATIPQLIA